MDAECPALLDHAALLTRKLPPRTRHRDDMGQARDDLAFAPLQNAAHRIGPGDEPKLHVIRVMRAQLAKRVGRVGDALPVHLDVAHVEMRVRRDRGGAHGKALGSRRDAPVLLKRRPAGHDEHHGIEPKSLARLLGAGEMPDMDGIERAAHDSQTSWPPVGAKTVEASAHHRPRPVFFPHKDSHRNQRT